MRCSQLYTNVKSNQGRKEREREKAEVELAIDVTMDFSFKFKCAKIKQVSLKLFTLLTLFL